MGEPTCPLCSLPLRVDWRGITASVLCTPECGYNDRLALQTPQSREAERLEEEVADLERRLAATKHIPPASRMGWFVCCIVDSRGETVGSFHLHVPGGATISEVVRREAKHHLQTHVVRGKRPVRYVVIPTTADLCTIGPEVEVRIVEPDEVSRG